MELALNNFEVLDQTQMEEVNGGGIGFVVAAAVTTAVFTVLRCVLNPTTVGDGAKKSEHIVTVIVTDDMAK